MARKSAPIVNMYEKEKRRFFIALQIGNKADEEIGLLRDQIWVLGGRAGARPTTDITVCAFDCHQDRENFLVEKIQELTRSMTPFKVKLQGVCRMPGSSIHVPVINPRMFKKIQKELDDVDLAESIDFFSQFYVRLAIHLELPVFQRACRKFGLINFQTSTEVVGMVLGYNNEEGRVYTDFPLEASKIRLVSKQS